MRSPGLYKSYVKVFGFKHGLTLAPAWHRSIYGLVEDPHGLPKLLKVSTIWEHSNESNRIQHNPTFRTRKHSMSSEESGQVWARHLLACTVRKAMSVTKHRGRLCQIVVWECWALPPEHDARCISIWLDLLQMTQLRNAIVATDVKPFTTCLKCARQSLVMSVFSVSTNIYIA